MKNNLNNYKYTLIIYIFPLKLGKNTNWTYLIRIILNNISFYITEIFEVYTILKKVMNINLVQKLKRKFISSLYVILICI